MAKIWFIFCAPFAFCLPLYVGKSISVPDILMQLQLSSPSKSSLYSILLMSMITCCGVFVTKNIKPGVKTCTHTQKKNKLLPSFLAFKASGHDNVIKLRKTAQRFVN